MSLIRVTALKWAPPIVQGLVRDLRVRWALEEAGLRYEENLVAIEEKNNAEYRELQPFQQVPAYQEGDLVLFESGAIVMHIAEKSETLLPREARARERARVWMFAALSSIEPFVVGLAEVEVFYAGEEWAKLRRPQVLEWGKQRLQQLSNWLGEREYLEDRFTAGDLLMTTVLRIVRDANILEAYPNLVAYRQRCEARPAFQKALAAQLAPFAKHAPTT